ncbi:hypothetical protein [Billgrantia antri]|uniref:hypothetical protein n=1 Tax=Billgrantia antri TaxID=2846777 RepID=UPI003B219ABB
MIEPQRALTPRQLEERIAYLQVTLAALTTQLESQHRLDDRADSDGPTAASPSPIETPLPIAAG